jgi:hypothetical protein
MTGGKISANLAATGEGGYTCGGGVYNDGTFTMTGGEISGNYSCDTANEDGGGVYNAGTFTVGGTAKITGNVAKAVYDYRTNSASGQDGMRACFPFTFIEAAGEFSPRHTSSLQIQRKAGRNQFLRWVPSMLLQ